MIDPRDVGAAAAAVLCSPGHGAGAGHEGQTYLLTGPSAITYAQVAAGLSAATQSRVEFVDLPGDAAYQAMIGDGMPGFVAEQIVAMFAALRQGVAAQVSRPDVNVGVLGIEAVDQRRDDAALALGVGDVGAAAIFRAAFAEETLQVDVGAVVWLGAAAERQRHQQRRREPLHRTAAPAIARTICFWKTM